MKISGLDELTSADDNDFLPIVDESEDETKYIEKQNLLGGIFPVGSIFMFGGSSAPDGWLLCDGSEVNRSTYSDLFTAIGETFGIGDGSTTFNLPDFQGRSPVGVGSGSGLTPRALGDSGGEEEHQLSVSEMPAHRHNLSDNDVSGEIAGRSGRSDTPTPYYTDYEGDDQPHNTMHPFLVVNFIIKY